MREIIIKCSDDSCFCEIEEKRSVFDMCGCDCCDEGEFMLRDFWCDSGEIPSCEC